LGLEKRSFFQGFSKGEFWVNPGIGFITFNGTADAGGSGVGIEPRIDFDDWGDIPTQSGRFDRLATPSRAKFKGSTDRVDVAPG